MWPKKVKGRKILDLIKSMKFTPIDESNLE